tara:strand:+ start:262 stop:2451 length:2190 start_codon:yes stop_codon:yes gene_type:complete
MTDIDYESLSDKDYKDLMAEKNKKAQAEADKSGLDWRGTLMAPHILFGSENIHKNIKTFPGPEHYKWKEHEWVDSEGTERSLKTATGPGAEVMLEHEGLWSGRVLLPESRVSEDACSWMKIYLAHSADVGVTGGEDEFLERVHKRLKAAGKEPADYLQSEIVDTFLQDMVARSTIHGTVPDKISRAVLPQHIRRHTTHASIRLRNGRSAELELKTDGGVGYDSKWSQDLYEVLFRDSPTSIALRVIDWWLSEDRDAVSDRLAVCEEAWEWCRKNLKGKWSKELSKGQAQAILEQLTLKVGQLRSSLTGDLTEVDGMSSWDALALRVLTDSVNTLSKPVDELSDYLKDFRKTSIERWSSWTGTQLPLIVSGKEIAGVSWKHILKNFLGIDSRHPIDIATRLARIICVDIRNTKVPALTTGVNESIQTVLFSSKNRRRVSINPNKQNSVQVYNDRGKIVAEISERQPLSGAMVDTDLLESIQTKLNKSNTVASHELFRYLVFTTYEQQAVNMTNPDRITVIGGYEELAVRCGLSSSNKNRTALKKLLDLYESIRIQDGSRIFRGLLWVKETSLEGSGQNVLSININDNLLQNYEQKLKKGDPYRSIIPLASCAPILHGRKNEWANQYNLQNIVIAEMRDQAPMLYETGTVEISTNKWLEMGDKAELTKKRTKQVKDLWVAGTSEREPMLLSPYADRYTLNPKVHGQELRLITQSGSISKKQSERAKRRKKK